MIFSMYLPKQNSTWFGKVVLLYFYYYYEEKIEIAHRANKFIFTPFETLYSYTSENSGQY
jgi:hypothetical protein